eukprot:3261614-Prymnesium_polylepis.1
MAVVTCVARALTLAVPAGRLGRGRLCGRRPPASQPSDVRRPWTDVDTGHRSPARESRGGETIT